MVLITFCFLFKGFKNTTTDRKGCAANGDLDSRNAQHIFSALLAHYPVNKSRALQCQKE